MCHLHTEGPAPYTEEDCRGIFETTCFFVGSNLRKAVADGEPPLSSLSSAISKGFQPDQHVLVLSTHSPSRDDIEAPHTQSIPAREGRSLTLPGVCVSGRAEYVPIYLSEIPNLFRRNILPVDVALVQVSPPDKHGYCSLGASHTPIYRHTGCENRTQGIPL